LPLIIRGWIHLGICIDTMVVDIVPMGLTHINEVYEIELLSFPVPWSRKSFRKELENSSSLSYAAHLPLNGGSKVVGYVCNWLIEDEFHILNLAVHPQHRRKGIGRTLLEYSLHRADQRDAEKAFLEVRRSNSPAIELYKKLGFRIIGVRPRYYSNNHEDAIIMTLDMDHCIQMAAPALE